MPPRLLYLTFNDTIKHYNESAVLDMKTAFCFDLDGTVTSEELLPLISREVDLYDEIECLTEATIKGFIPFESSFNLRCKLLSTVSVSRITQVVLNVGLYKMITTFINERSNKNNCFVITGNLDCWINPLRQKINCTFFSSLAIVENDQLISVEKVIDKSNPIKELRQSFDRIVAIGDGMGDVSMFEEADIAIAYGATHEPVQSLIEYSDFLVYDERSLCTILNML